ncbi:MAG: holo-ACP synthase [Proteobacteria bacterium]|nr:holo-ACP synthase [Pseudomonadota bacterium]
MIFGIGSDLVQLVRIEATLRRFGPHFVERLLLPEERARFDRLPPREARRVRFLAQRFAAKEAIVKALGTGFAHGLWIRDCGFVPNAWGRPEVVWSPRGARRAAELGAGAGHVTLTDEGGFVMAVAVLERAAAARPG